jgi:hypothetical protein
VLAPVKLVSSEPQIPAAVTVTTAVPGSANGRGRRSTDISCGPRKTSAIISSFSTTSLMITERIH